MKMKLFLPFLYEGVLLLLIIMLAGMFGAVMQQVVEYGLYALMGLTVAEALLIKYK